MMKSIINKIIRRAKIYWRLPSLLAQINIRIDEALSATDKRFQQANKLVEKINKKFRVVDDRTVDIQDKLDFLELDDTQRESKSSTQDRGVFANNHTLDAFYVRFEDKFRGTQEEISKRLKEDYGDFFKRFSKQDGQIVDIGSGRGEMIGLLNELNLSIYGVDLNKRMVKQANKNNLDTIEDDGTAHVRALSKNSTLGITGIHLIEHLPFEDLYTFLKSCYRAIKKDGFVLFETPNPENLHVAAMSFYYDPSHLRPLPPELIKYSLETVGFDDIEIRQLHPKPEYEKHKKSEVIPSHVAKAIYGPQDYAVIAYKRDVK